MNNESSGIFDEVRNFPDPGAQRRFAGLVGLEATKSRLLKEATLLIDPSTLKKWAERHHRGGVKITEYFRDRAPLFLFAGDVGTGKTALAESVGDAIARTTGMEVALFGLSLTARGTGAVGQMTTLLTSAFAQVRQEAQKGWRKGSRPSRAVILLVDEADALAQSREATQMHHEDRAGVNALIRGVDDLGQNGLPAIVIMCTNRLEAIDPAVRRRAAGTFAFGRPTDAQRQAVLQDALGDLGFSKTDIDALVEATGPREGRSYGFTYSDLTQRLLPTVVLEAYPERPVAASGAIVIARTMTPTPPFRLDSFEPARAPSHLERN